MNISLISDYIFIEDKDLKGDVGIVFGTWNVWKESIDLAEKLFAKGVVPKFIVSGGKNPESGIIEGDLMASELERLGVPRRNIFVENRSTNTLENVLFSKHIIEHELGIGNVKVITAVVKNFHARRVSMTLRKQFPEDIKFRIAAYESLHFPFNRGNWHKTRAGKQHVMGELIKIQKYLKKGDVAEI